LQIEIKDKHTAITKNMEKQKINKKLKHQIKHIWIKLWRNKNLWKNYIQRR
jgi:hypothetical protein